MLAELEVELTEKLESEKIETRRFSRVVEMDLPALGEQIELNVASEPVMAVVMNITRNTDGGGYRIAIKSNSLTFKSLREDERWQERLLSA
jgi:hypothetical protein